jgi:hypothetical protein
MSRDALSYFHNVLTYKEGEAFEYWNNFSLKISFKSKQKHYKGIGAHFLYWCKAFI